MIDRIYTRLPDETDEMLLYRIYSEREEGLNRLTCDEAGGIMNELTGNEYTEVVTEKHINHLRSF